MERRVDKMRVGIGAKLGAALGLALVHLGQTPHKFLSRTCVLEPDTKLWITVPELHKARKPAADPACDPPVPLAKRCLGPLVSRSLKLTRGAAPI